ncbi:bleomycin hydrolase [Parabacteroides sp. PF5-5]|uniref:C1 family peptidase n=1 Tax=unclassified Parabacteroides TaxID=2649774 RepID=UPI002474DF94|nr:MULTISPECIES: C1 family peptidase [unclassified Parabacteroides]MDH6305393.1 bleomycin hydrolase [Parabacteroides sp. PH5-39]MDH6316103.1 bleomycin hydrolase [Parabacteroides sp. PF5-13]MDH6320253.1 bleomycin hydrolase [Parabacteroides sp. PH5-13]MDH6323983.1 bleomycin hydrolase [Parabacteroides sp. PH5-8]MDH6327294.1 bleomycin hydrolase [Parabacteroides sp. PH5-41]
MRRNLFLTLIAIFTVSLSVSAQQTKGGISNEMLKQIKEAYQGSQTDKALQNAIANNDINKLSVNLDNKNNFDTYFSHRVNSKGITNQKSSGRCWLFTGLNVFRSKIIAKHNLSDFQFSHNYPFFWDQLEKANLFLQGIVDIREKPMDDKMVEWLFKNPLSDGGQFTGVADILSKYGVVPADVMAETYSSENTRMMANLISLKLKEFGLQLRELSAKGSKPADLEKKKTEMLGTVYRMLALSLGEPPASFSWTLKDAKGNPVSTKEYTPLSFYQEFIGADLKNNYVMLMNDPSREYYKLYEIDFDRHAYDGKNWTYVNLPAEDIKEMAIRSIKDSTMMYFSCDVGKFFDRERGLLDVNYYDYGSLMGTTFGMDKKQRIQTFSSGSSHAMTLMAVDLDANSKPKKWMVENSWGPGANNGHLIMTDEWFNEYMFRLVIENKYASDKVKEILKQKPTRLPAWDPMFMEED